MRLLLTACFSLFLAGHFTGAAQAQLQLPGAFGGGGAPAAPPPGSTPGAASGAPGAPAKPKSSRPPEAPVSVKAPGDDAITGREFRQNGAIGTLAFSKRDKDLVISQFILTGYQISRPGAQCRIEVAGGPFVANPAGRREGLLRYETTIESCPIAFDVLDGAVRVNVTGNVCEFKQADCRAEPSGIWGPSGNSFNPDLIKSIERQRGRMDQTARASFRSLLATAHDRAEIKKIAADQASFSSRREEACRDYARESVHGFCALRMTEARAVALRARLNPKDDMAVGSTPPPVKKRPARPKPAAAGGPAPMNLQ